MTLALLLMGLLLTLSLAYKDFIGSCKKYIMVTLTLASHLYAHNIAMTVSFRCTVGRWAMHRKVSRGNS